MNNGYIRYITTRVHTVTAWTGGTNVSCEITTVVPLPFDMSPVTPSIVRNVLCKCLNGSTPGPDGISYYHLKSLHCTHHFLATLFSKILFTSHIAPSSWCSAKLILIHKKDDKSCPSNFRPIALTSTIGKVFHRIISRRLETYRLSNNLVDPSIQKGFLSGIDRVVEHILSLNSIITTSNLPLFMTFIDLRNAFGSVHHTYIKDILTLIKLPFSAQFQFE